MCKTKFFDNNFSKFAYRKASRFIGYAPLDELITQDNMVRGMDAFEAAIDLMKLGFTQVTLHKY